MGPFFRTVDQPLGEARGASYWRVDCFWAEPSERSDDCLGCVVAVVSGEGRLREGSIIGRCCSGHAFLPVEVVSIEREGSTDGRCGSGRLFFPTVEDIRRRLSGSEPPEECC